MSVLIKILRMMFGVINKKSKGGEPEKFDGNRPIKAIPSVGDIPGGKTPGEVIENMFYGFIKATISLNAIPLQEVGATHSVRLRGSITPNDEDVINDQRVSVMKAGEEPVIIPINDNNLDYTITGPDAVALGINYRYKFLADVGGNGSPHILESVERVSEGIFPYLWGASDNPDLEGLALYNTLTLLMEKEGNKQVVFNGENKYFYFCLHEDYNDLSQIIDQNGFSLSDFLASKTIREVESVNGWTENFKVYRSGLTTINNGNYKFNR